MKSQLNPSATNGGDITVSGEGIHEDRRFSKRQIEELRKKILRENSQTFTKRDFKNLR